ncbi:MAG: Multi-sensor signal transduction histidine kinase, partial [Pedosphaera sp.]|nr:Multi-sensor signal transduction histidine kinase [Pedosphaera sp.]
ENQQWTESSSSPEPGPGDLGAGWQEDGVFRLLFESSQRAILLHDPETQAMLDCNPAAVLMWGCARKEEILRVQWKDLAPEFQPDGSRSADRIAETARRAMENRSQAFEWMARRVTGQSFEIEGTFTFIQFRERSLLATICRDISELKKTEARIQQQTHELEARVHERTVELVGANEQLKAEIRGRRRKEKIQTALYQISEAIHTTEDLDSLYKRIHATIRGLMHAKNFYIALHDPGTELVHFSYFVDEVDPVPTPMKMTTGPTGRVLRTGKSLLVYRQTLARESQPGGTAMVEPGGEVFYVETGSAAAVWLGVPLSDRGQVFGVMAVQDYHNEKAYGEEERQILTFIGEQTALAIQRKRSEQALRESEQKFRALFEAGSQGVMLHDEHQLLEVNPATVRILGFNGPEDLVGRHPAEISAPIQLNGEPAEGLARRHIEACITNGSTRFDWLTRHAKGHEIPIEVILTRIQMGGRYLIQAVFNDISERKRAEAELHRTLAREKELGQLKGNFVSMVSHEFRTPLGVIMSSAEILASYFDQLEANERLAHLESIQKNTRRMANLMEEVLLFSTVEAGKMDFRPAPLKLEGFCRRLTEDLLAATGRKCPILFTGRSLPAAALADERLLRHIFTNLLTNAVKYSKPGLAVHFEIARDGTEALCRVRDEGIGIPEADLEWLFKAFHRGGNVGNAPGNGLGLVIVKRCVELHGGQIIVESVVGKGTAVTVRVPAFPVA